MKIHIICGIKDAGKHSMPEQYAMGLKLCCSEDKNVGTSPYINQKFKFPA